MFCLVVVGGVLFGFGGLGWVSLVYELLFVDVCLFVG